MERTSIKELVKWKGSSRRKPLVIEGARQVGKTWLVKEFARQNYKQLAYVNFENMKVLQKVFIQDFDIDRIVTAIGAATPCNMYEGRHPYFSRRDTGCPQCHHITQVFL